MNTLNLIALLDFGGVVSESIQQNQTETGRAILEKYSTITMSSPVTCNMVNNFLNESKQHLYDNGIRSAVQSLTENISKNQFSWALSTVCENINNNDSKYNYLNRNAAKQVAQLLEGRDEEEVVKYIKAGALKNVMFCESIRNIVKGIYKDQAVVVETQNFKVEHPLSYIEESGDKIYFMMEGRTFGMDKDMKIVESINPGDTSYEFKGINKIIKEMKFEDDTFSYTIPGKMGDIEFQISESNMVTRISGTEEKDFTVEELRENNRMFLNTINPAYKGKVAESLEFICKVAEKYDQIALLEEVSMIKTKDQVLSIVEGKDSVTLSLHKSRTHQPFTRTYTSIVEALNSIKNTMKVDLTSVFEASIEKEVNENKVVEEKMIKESLTQSETQTRKNRIEALTEKYKNDPATLAVLASLAAEID